jgi:CRP-like cAMP-binding protein
MDASKLSQRYQNKLLALLPEADLVHLKSLLTLRQVSLKEVLVAQGQQIRHIDFPCSSVYSSIVEFSDGSAVEVGTIGNEGMTNVGSLMAARVATSTVMCQIPGDSLRMGIEDFQWEMDRNPRLRLILHLYGQAYLAQIEQFAACNKLHSLEQRAARSLLMTHDRVGQSEIPLTQEFLAMMLGVQRPSVTMVAQKFQNAGALTYTRGKIRILQRTLLESACCECYHASEGHFKRLLGVRAG